MEMVTLDVYLNVTLVCRDAWTVKRQTTGRQESPEPDVGGSWYILAPWACVGAGVLG